MWLTNRGATPQEEKILGLLWTDLESVAEPYLRDIIVEIFVGDEHFSPAESLMVGACEHKSDKSYHVFLRRMSPGALYRTALHEIGHALGLEHKTRGVMQSARRQRTIPLSAERRRRWLRDFVNQLLTAALPERIK